MKKLWFKAKDYGWGWYPVAWQGWLVVAGFVAFTVISFCRIDSRSNSVSDTLVNFIPEAFVLILILMAICVKTGEFPRWNAASKKKKVKSKSKKR